MLAAQARVAVDTGQLDCDPDQLAFELGAILAGTDIISVLHDDTGAVSRARAAVHGRLDG